jgi:16S rRNA (uracil1498-N3)-methyltransferase
MARALIHLVENGRVLLPKEELHHLVRVRRLKAGDKFEALDVEEEKVYRCSLSKEGGSWHGLILDILEVEADPLLRITLAQALIKKDKFEWVIQKATELGVSEIIPILTCRTEIRLDEKREQRKLQRWSKIVAEAVKQCGRSRLPILGSPVSLATLLKERTEGLWIVLDEATDVPMRQLLAECHSAENCILLVGPEGGWDDRDREILSAEKSHSVSLGPRIMRAETASIAALAVLQYELGDFNG